jgi:hypothetical protein
LPTWRDPWPIRECEGAYELLCGQGKGWKKVRFKPLGKYMYTKTLACTMTTYHIRPALESDVVGQAALVLGVFDSNRY